MESALILFLLLVFSSTPLIRVAARWCIAAPMLLAAVAFFVGWNAAQGALAILAVVALARLLAAARGHWP